MSFRLIAGADAEDDDSQQHDGDGNDNTHSGLDSGALSHETHHCGGDDAAGGADEGHGAHAQIVAPGAFRAQYHGGGVDGGHKEANTHDADENGQLGAAEEHQQEEAEHAHTVGQQDVLSVHTAHQNRADHPSDEHDYPKQAGHELADPVTEDAGILEIGHQPVDDGVLSGNVEKEDQQKVLEMLNVRRRMETVLVFIKKEQELLRIQKKISAEINEKVEKNQREYFLREELKSIKEELGMTTDAKSSDYQKFKEKIDSFNFEGEIKETVESELDKFSLMDPNSSEYIVSRNYLELVSNLPWEAPAPENYDINAAKAILDEDHYGLEDVKKRIIEYLAVRKLKNDSKGSIILLVGPPGVGKTSVGRSIARAMNKEFYRFSVGGMNDEAEIKGHRRTYVGAMPGKILQGLKIVKTASPVFLIDEVDKIGSSYKGDPASALLEVLDPEQNVAFRDHYLDLPFDVSNILFILTANSLDTIPGPLLDRAEIISLSGYIDQEKIEIGKNYLLPKSLEKNGLKNNQVKYSKESLLLIANSYAREAGVRNFEKNLDKIHRKYATELVTSEEVILAKENLLKAEESKIKSDIKAAKTAYNKAIGKSLSISPKDIEKYLGKPVFNEEEIIKADIPGTAIGLAWTSMGGDTLLIEAMDLPAGAGKGGLQLTGQLGDVMKESCSIAMSWVRSYALKNKLCKLKYFEENAIHLHVPEGATPKDGPSAGITMATALMSLVRKKKIKPNIAMTGELSLTGKVLPIGGLREKTVAAKRNKIKTIIIPKQNQRDLEEIPEEVKKGLTFYPVSTMEEVLKIVF